VFVSTDNLGFYRGTAESTRAAIIETCRLKPSELFLCAIHTHSAPTLTLASPGAYSNNVAYTELLQRQLVVATHQALAKLEPVRIGLGSGASPVGVNRREAVRKEGAAPTVVLGRNPTGACDPEVQVMKVASLDSDKPLVVLFGYATHSTSLGPRNQVISGDVHGLAEQFLETHFGSDVVAPAFAGASGDIDPWYRVLPEFNTDNGWLPEPVLLGTMLGEEVAHVMRRMTTMSTNGPIESVFQTVRLPRKSATNGEPSTAEMNVTLARIGDIAFVGLGGEVFNQIGKAIKAGSPFRQTFVFTHCNGTAGYLPTTPSYPEGGYEVESTSFAAGSAEQLVEKTVSALHQLYRSNSSGEEGSEGNR
jgi:hypothetical protein